MSSVIRLVIVQFCEGIKDSIRGVVLIYSLDKNIQKQQLGLNKRAQEEKNNRIRQFQRSNQGPQPTPAEWRTQDPRVLGRICMSSALAAFVWLSIWAFSLYILPMLHYYTKMITQLLSDEEGTSYEGIWVYFELILHWTFSTLWVLPLYTLSKAINGFWFADVSNAVYKYEYGPRRSFPSVSMAVADFIYSILVESIFLVQANVALHIPLEGINHLLYSLHICLLYALYAFEYKWFNMGMELKLRLQLVDQHWPYFCGFGLPLYLMTNVVFSYYPSVVSACIFSIAFPFFIVSGTQASTPRHATSPSLRIFEPSVSLCSHLFSAFIKIRDTRRN